MHRSSIRSSLPVGAAALGVYLVLSLRPYQRLEVPTFDLGIFDQAIRAMAAFHAPIVHLKGAGVNIFGDHFHPVIALLVPVYWVAPSPASLLVAQDLLVAVSALVVTRVAVDTLGPRRGVVLGLAYAFSWGLQTAVAAQFHEVAFAVPLLAASLAALVRQQWRACALWAAPLVFVKEDLGVTVAVIGLVVAWRSRGAAARLGGALVVWGIAWVVVAVRVVLPALHGDAAWSRQDQIPWASLRDPVALLGHLTMPAVKVQTVVLLLAVTGFLALRSSLLLVALPTLFWRFLAEDPAYWGPFWHYSAVLMPVAFLALIDALAAFRTSARAQAAGAGRFARIADTLALPVCVAMAVLGVLVFPLANLLRPGFYGPGPRTAAGAEILRDVRPDAVVEDGSRLGLYLTGRDDVYWWGRTGAVIPEYVLVDRSASSPIPATVTGSSGAVESVVEQAHPGVGYSLVAEREGFVLLRRVSM